MQAHVDGSDAGKSGVGRRTYLGAGRWRSTTLFNSASKSTTHPQPYLTCMS